MRIVALVLSSATTSEMVPRACSTERFARGRPVFISTRPSRLAKSRSNAVSISSAEIGGPSSLITTREHLERVEDHRRLGTLDGRGSHRHALIDGKLCPSCMQCGDSGAPAHRSMMGAKHTRKRNHAKPPSLRSVGARQLSCQTLSRRDLWEARDDFEAAILPTLVGSFSFSHRFSLALDTDPGALSAESWPVRRRG